MTRPSIIVDDSLELMSTLFAQLKSSTEKEHREIEAIIDPLKNFHRIESYKTHLLKSWIFYQSIEEKLALLRWSDIGFDFKDRRKLLLLEEDLRVLDIKFRPRKSPQEDVELLNLDFGIGCLYVTEGATLGGQIISRSLGQLGIGPTSGGLFFHGYGAKTGEMWKSFRAMATDHCVTENQIEQAIRGAKSTFAKFRNTMFNEDLIHEP
jgi:heme oxygenase